MMKIRGREQLRDTTRRRGSKLDIFRWHQKITRTVFICLSKLDNSICKSCCFSSIISSACSYSIMIGSWRFQKKSVIYSHWTLFPSLHSCIHAQCDITRRDQIFTLSLARTLLLSYKNANSRMCKRKRRGRNAELVLCANFSFSLSRAHALLHETREREEESWKKNLSIHLFSFLSIKLILTFLNKWYFH